MAEQDRLLDTFAELRRTWDDLIGLQPDIVAASGPLTKVDLDEFEQRVQAHQAALSVLAGAVPSLRQSWR